MNNSFAKSQMSEEDIRLKYITPAILKSGWDIDNQIYTEYSFTDGRVIIDGKKTKRGSKKRADYILYYKPNMPLAIVEAKDNKKSVGDGMQQALDYSEILDIPFAYSSNGDAFIEHDRTMGTEREISLDEFPAPDELWQRYCGYNSYSDKQRDMISTPYYFEYGDKTPRYYQRIAINRTVEAIAKGQERILLVMATGTGKTYTAFQIIHRLHKSGLKKKILYLADRNILIDQTISQDFRPFEKIITKVDGKKLDSSYEIYMSLYQQLAGDENVEPFREFKPEFFDLIIIDECHRGSANEDSRWRKILDYFSSATHIGLTATPKETNKTSNISYFGEALYTYSLKQGIDDGFLAPYKVVRVGTNVGLMGYRPPEGKLDEYGYEIEDREYNDKDFDKNLVIDERTKVVAKYISDYLKATNRFDKTIIFCIDIEHAERMRQALVNENSDLVKANSKYIMRITGDNKEGKAQLDNFIDANELYPTIVTTSKLMTTGVDCKTCKLIVLENNINSMTEFKQIIGRGTRLKPDAGKEYFTIIDFRNATRLFADPNFDGDPVVVIETPVEEPPVQVEPTPEPEPEPTSPYPEPEPTEPFEKRYIRGVNVQVSLTQVRILGANGKLITESITDYSRKNILGEYPSLEDFISKWNGDEKKRAIIDELLEKGVFIEELKAISSKDIDEFDLICHIAFDKKPLTKAERINNVKKRDYLNKYNDLAKKVLEALLDKYAMYGIFDIEDSQILYNEPFNKWGAPPKIAKEAFGGKTQFEIAVKELELELYTL